MKITQKNKLTIEKMHLISGESKSSIRNLFESLLVLLVLNHMEGELTNIPFIGTLSIEYIDEKITNGKKEANIKVKLNPDSNLIKNVGQVQDKEECDIEKMIKLRVVEALRKYL